MEGRAPLRSACVNVFGRCTVASGAELSVAHCRNVNPYGYGGGAYVNRALHVDGALEVHQSHSSFHGGGIHVNGTSAQLLGLRVALEAIFISRGK